MNRHTHVLAVASAVLTLIALLATGEPSQAAPPPALRAARWTLTTAADWRAGTLEGLAAVNDGDDGALTLTFGHTAGRFTSPVHRAPFPFTAAALFWTAGTTDGSGLAVEVRLSRDRVTWSPWYPIHNPETQPDGRTYGENVVVLDGARFVQVRVVLSAPAPTRFPTLYDLTVVLIDAGDAPTPAQALAASGPVRPSALSRPTIISREAWGAEHAYLDWEPEYAPVQRMVLHHTVTEGGGNPVAEVQAIYYYHAVTRGWGDIGYNYLVDPYGNVYEGRYGGDDVIGAHTARWNTGALGVALLGCYDPNDCSPGQTPSAAAMDAIAGLTAWTASRRVIDPRQETTFTNVYDDSPLTLFRLTGHRDYGQYLDGQWYNATSCPGDTLYGELAGLRDDAWSRLPDDDARFDGHDTPALLQPGQTITVSLSLRNAGKTPWTPGDVRLGYRWLDGQGTLVAEKTDAGSLSAEVAFADTIPLTATLTAPPITGTYTLRWDLYRPGAGWFADLSSASEPLEVPVTVVNLSHRLFLPLLARGEGPEEACDDVLVNGGAEGNTAWEFVGGWPGAYSLVHARSGDRAIRLGVESADDDGYLYSSAQQTVGLPADAARITLSFWRYPTSGNPDDDRAYVALLDSGGSLLDTLWLDVGDSRTWQQSAFDLTAYRGQTVVLRFTVVNQTSPGTTADWLDDLSLAVCAPDDP